MHPYDQGTDPASQLAAFGRFADAMAALPEAAGRFDSVSLLLRADLFERLGRFSQSDAMLQRLAKLQNLSEFQLSWIDLIRGRLCAEHGDFNGALASFQRAALTSARAVQPELSCVSRLHLLELLADTSGPDATSTMISELKGAVGRIGAPALTIMLHLAVGRIEGRRGLLQNARRHCHAALRLITDHPNIWLEAMAQSSLAAIATMSGDVDAAWTHGHRALSLADESGAANARIATLGNLGALLYQSGEFAQAADFVERAIALCAVGGEKACGARDTLALIYLAQDRLVDCRRVLSEIEEAIRNPSDAGKFAYRYVLLTKTFLLVREGLWADALDCVNKVASFAEIAGDVLLRTVARLTKAEVLLHLDDEREAVAILADVANDIQHKPPVVHAQYERVIALMLLLGNRGVEAASHFALASQIYANVGGSKALPRIEGISPALDMDFGDSQAALLSTVWILSHVRNARLVASEIIHMLGRLNCINGARAIILGDNGDREIVAMCGEMDGDATQKLRRIRRVQVGRSVLVELEAKDLEVQSIATVNAIAVLLSTIHELERARAEREERLTLWPIEDVQLDDGRAVVNGKMRELMDLVRKVAGTNVVVLITGESGTGKEIIARAVHTCSDRARKPFVPFNCTAVPHELLESQLFGHRRGAFTGADRDNPGLIRSARDGTLFLDEIGEMGLDLQPKLLRFLESSEISPLGEATPTRVDVRIIAATNANLEDAVREGRFREDLFYRLNVIRLEVPPLRERRDEIPALAHYFVGKAAVDFKKGRVRLAEDAMEQLLLYDWPGNIRQLHNELRRLVALAEPDSVIGADLLSKDIANARPAATARSHGEAAVSLHGKLHPTLARIEREMIKVALREHRGRVDAAAKALGISRKGLYLKRQRHGL